MAEIAHLYATWTLLLVDNGSLWEGCLAHRCDYRCFIDKKAFNRNASTMAFLVLKVVLYVVVLILEVLHLSIKSHCSRCCIAH